MDHIIIRSITLFNYLKTFQEIEIINVILIRLIK